MVSYAQSGHMQTCRDDDNKRNRAGERQCSPPPFLASWSWQSAVSPKTFRALWCTDRAPTLPRRRRHGRHSLTSAPSVCPRRPPAATVLVARTGSAYWYVSRAFEISTADTNLTLPCPFNLTCSSAATTTAHPSKQQCRGCSLGRSPCPAHSSAKFHQWRVQVSPHCRR